MMSLYLLSLLGFRLRTRVRAPDHPPDQIPNLSDCKRLGIFLFFKISLKMPFAHIFAHKLVGKLFFHQIHRTLTGPLVHMSIGVQRDTYI